MNIKLPRAFVPPEKNVPKPNFDSEIGRLATDSVRFIPPERRTEQLGVQTVRAVQHFADLPTKYLDDLILGVKDRISSIEQKAEDIKNDYQRRTTALAAEIERLNSACMKSEAKMSELHEQLTQIYRPTEDDGGPVVEPDDHDPRQPGGDAA